MSLEWADGVLDFFVRCGPWSLSAGVSLEHLLGEPVMRMAQSAYRKTGFSVARCLSAEINLPGIFVLVSIGKVGRRL